MLVAETKRTSMRFEFVLPTGRTSPNWSTRSSLIWRSGVVSEISSRNTVPRSAAANRPDDGALGARERTLLVTEQLTLDDVR